MNRPTVTTACSIGVLILLILSGCGVSHRETPPPEEPGVPTKPPRPADVPEDTVPQPAQEQPPSPAKLPVEGRPIPDTPPQRAEAEPVPADTTHKQKREEPPPVEPPSADTIPSQPSPRLPFRPGERLTYSLTYTGIPLATMKLHLQDGPVREGNPTFEITGSLKTHGVASWIVSIDDRVRSIVNKDPLFSWSFTHRENHNGDRKVESSRYDRHRSVVMDHKNDTTPVEHPVHDPISALYALRVLPLTGLASRTHQVFLDGELYSVKIERQDREQLHTVVGRVWAHKLHVTTSKDDLKKTMKEGHAGFWIWVTEERGLPVQIRIPAAVGSIWAELSAYSPGRTVTQD